MRILQKFKKETFEKYAAPVAVLLIAANLLTVLMCIVSEGTFLRAFLMPSGWAFVMNTLFVYMPMLVLFFLVRKTWIAFLPFSVLFCAFNYFDYLKVSIRGETILPCDFTILTEAAETTGMLEFEITLGLITAVVMIAAITLGLFFFDKLVIKKNGLVIRLRNGAIIAAVTLAVFVGGFFATFLNPSFLNATGLTAYQWKQLNTRNNNGFLVNFLANIPYVLPEKPSGYGKESAEATYGEVLAELNAAYTDGSEDAGAVEKPNIIIVMNESFTDADKFSYINFERSTTPTLHEIAQTKTGGAHFTPQFGGGTANVEFELLTGYSLRYLPASSTPYQQHVKKTTPSYVSFLRDELGYSTTAIHSYGPHFWNRDNVYPLIGFEKFVSEPDFALPLRMRTYVSDESTADMIIKQYEENRATGKPFFNFTVTMQNHGSYSGNDYDEGTMINATDGSMDLRKGVFGAIRSYATSICFADDMLRQLTDYFSTCGEPTIVMFFGDHLGSFGNKEASYFASGYTKNSTDTPEGFYDLHTPPFVIWDNYTDVSASPDTALSTYYLIPYMTETYSLPQPVYFKYLLQQSGYVKGTGGDYYLRGDGSIAESGSVTEEENAELERQHMFQYDALFGKQYVTDKIWARYK
jgi:phosphoglycerol transferase MdoB-like AlkP superfamily enzyme